MKKILKKALYYVTRMAQISAPYLHSVREQNGKGYQSIVFFPEFNNLDDLKDQVSRIKWYLPNRSNVKVFICLGDGLRDVDLRNLPAPEYHREPLSYAIVPDVLERRDIIAEMRNADVVCLWNLSKHFGNVLKVIMVNANLFRIRITDPDFYLFSETHSYPAIYEYELLSATERKIASINSVERMEKMFGEFDSFKKVYVFGTGPSVRQALRYDFSDGVRIICNSMVKDDELLAHIQPNVLIFLDSVFHFGVSKYAGEFAKDVIKVVRKYNPYVITNQVGAALMQAQYPELREKMIAVPAVRYGPPVRLIPSSFKTRDYTNVLTRYMLPLGAGLANKLILIGFDGRAPSETYFWRHNSSTQYVNRMDSTKLAHPAFFRDIDYQNYYEEHCKILDDMLARFESEGVEVRSLTESFIPAFACRQEKDTALT